MTVEVREITPSDKLMTYDELLEHSQYVKQLPNWPSGLIPQKGDIIRLYFGDYKETEEVYFVLYRIIDFIDSNKITLIVRNVDRCIVEDE